MGERDRTEEFFFFFFASGVRDSIQEHGSKVVILFRETLNMSKNPYLFLCGLESYVLVFNSQISIVIHR